MTSRNHIIIGIIGLAILLLVTSIFMFNPFKGPYKIVETKAFACENVSGFTFDYPVFEGWEEANEHKMNNGCSISLNRPASNIDSNIEPSIQIQKIDKPGKPAPDSPIMEYPPNLTLNNPYSVPYKGDVTNSSPSRPATEAIKSVSFFANDYAVEITIQPVADLGDGFSSKEFLKTVIESFVFEDESMNIQS